MKRSLLIVAYGAGGLLVAIGLTFGAFALAGKDISTPAGHVKIQTGEQVVPVPETTRQSPKPDRSPDTSIGPSEGADDHGGEATETPTPTRTDGGGGESEDSGSGNSGSGDSGSEDSGSDGDD